MVFLLAMKPSADSKLDRPEVLLHLFEQLADRLDRNELPATIKVKIFPHHKNYLPQMKDRQIRRVSVSSSAACEMYLVDHVESREVFMGRSDRYSFRYQDLPDSLLKLECDQPFKVHRAFGLPTYRYEGDLFVYKDIQKKQVVLVNQVSLESYLRGVVPSEVYTHWPMAMLEAQAVAARTYAMYHKKISEASSKTLFDVDDTILYQAYTGLDKINKKTDAAILNTSGQVLRHQGKLIQAYYHADSGGVTEDARAVWNGSSSSYAVSKVEPYFQGDKGRRSSRWKESLNLRTLSESMISTGQLSQNESIRQIAVSKRTRKSRRVKKVRIKTNRREFDLSYQRFSRFVNFPSSLFRFYHGSNPYTLSVKGYGFGHGVGLSQQGGKYLAETKNWNFRKILKFYYHGVDICQIGLSRQVCL